MKENGQVVPPKERYKLERNLTSPGLSTEFILHPKVGVRVGCGPRVIKKLQLPKEGVWAFTRLAVAV